MSGGNGRSRNSARRGNNERGKHDRAARHLQRARRELAQLSVSNIQWAKQIAKEFEAIFIMEPSMQQTQRINKLVQEVDSFQSSIAKHNEFVLKSNSAQRYLDKATFKDHQCKKCGETGHPSSSCIGNTADGPVPLL